MMKTLFDLGFIDEYPYTKKEIAKLNGQKRVNNKWPKVKKILDWIQNEYGTLNISHHTKNPENFPNELFDGLRHKNIGSLITKISVGQMIPDNVDLEKEYTYFFETKKFEKYRFQFGLEFYYRNTSYSYPRHGVVLDEIFLKNYEIQEILPKYMNNYKLGDTYCRWKKGNLFTNDILELIENNTNKPNETPSEILRNNPDIRQNSIEQAKKAKAKRTQLDDEITKLKKLLNKKFEPAKKESRTSGGKQKYFIESYKPVSEDIQRYQKYYKTFEEAKIFTIEAYYFKRWWVINKLCRIYSTTK